MKCNGDTCNFSSLLDKDGKLGSNWVRRSECSRRALTPTPPYPYPYPYRDPQPHPTPTPKP
jgi:hypothetical protein